MRRFALLICYMLLFPLLVRGQNPLPFNPHKLHLDFVAAANGPAPEVAYVQLFTTRREICSMEGDRLDARWENECIAHWPFHRGDTLIIWAVAKDMLPAFDTLFIASESMLLTHTVHFKPLRKGISFPLYGVDIDPLTFAGKGEEPLILSDVITRGQGPTEAMLAYFFNVNKKIRAQLSLFYPDSAGEMRFNKIFTQRLFGNYFNTGVPYHHMHIHGFKKIPDSVLHAGMKTKAIAFMTITKA